MTNSGDIAALNAESQQLWDGKAVFWDEYVGAEGNAFHRVLVAPAVRHLLAMQPGERLLEVACGNGQFAREMAELGVQVLATDFSTVFLARARARSAQIAPEVASRITYQQVDATDEEQLLALGTYAFDGAVCNMGLMDMPTIEPLMRALTQLLKPGGRFVFAIQHPCFNQNSAIMMAELHDNDGALQIVHAVKVSRYINPYGSKGAGIAGEPNPHYYWHRPLNDLLSAGFRAGLVLDGLEEPVFPPETQSKSVIGWGHFTEIPPVLVARLRRV